MDVGQLNYISAFKIDIKSITFFMHASCFFFFWKMVYCFCNLKISRMLGLHKVTLNGFMLSLTNIHVSPKNKSIIRQIESSKPHSHVQNVKALAERLYLYSVKGRNSIKSKSMEGDGRLVNRLNWSPHNVTQGRIRGWNDMRGYRNRCPWGEMKISSKPCDHIEAFPFSSTVT